MNAVVGALAAWLAASSAAPGPSRGGRPEAHVRNAECEACHPEVAREWRGSLHQRAYVDESFARALAREPVAFCRKCHAPEADPAAPAPAELAELGVGCVSCHVPEDRVLAGPGPGRGAAPHALRREAWFAAPVACASCHEFAFPGQAGALMQATLREHAASAYAATSCVDCHMPRRADGRRDHGFAASRDPEVLRRALTVTASREGSTVRLVLRPGWVGHAMPTGDLFRRLLVEAEVAGDDWQVLAADARALGRSFAAEGGRRVPVADARVGAAGPEPVEVALELGDAAEGRTIRWRLLYERVSFVDDLGAAEVEARTTVAEGALTASARRRGR